MITIVDYGLGNIKAFSNVYKRMNIDSRVAACAQELKGSTHIILPGVGAFDHAMQLLEGSGMRQTLDVLVLERHVPVLGICVGMQILSNSSEEGVLPGLGWIPGSVRSFKSEGRSTNLPLPHMGWNDVRPIGGLRLFEGLENEARFYFLHSFFFECAQPEHTAANTEYGVDFSSAVCSGNVYGVQFHPEKSHRYGATLLKNFSEL